MNLSHLKYACEVARTNSITKAAQNLFMGQPALSRAIRELEEEMGQKLFKRTAKGIALTMEGERFLPYAKDILAKVEKMERAFQKDESNQKQTFSISVPRASYISSAFLELVKTFEKDKEVLVRFKETNALRAVTNIEQNNFDLGIVRYQKVFEPYFINLFTQKGLKFEEIFTFKDVVVMSKNHPLSEKENLTSEDLNPFLRIARGDPYVPTLTLPEIRKQDDGQSFKRTIFVYERCSQFEMLSGVEGTYTWSSPLPKEHLERYGLVQRLCLDASRTHKDVLVHAKGYHLSEIDQKFLFNLKQIQEQISQQKIR